MSKPAEDSAYKAFEPNFPLSQDAGFREWQIKLKHLSKSELAIRQATASGEDGRRLKDLQAACESMSVLSVQKNVETIASHQVLLAELDGIHVGFCLSLPGSQEADPLFIQAVGVEQAVGRRGIGLALLSTAAGLEPQRDIALATRGDNIGAHALIQRLAASVGASIHRVKLDTYPNCQLGISRGMGYRSWVIQRPSNEASRI